MQADELVILLAVLRPIGGGSVNTAVPELSTDSPVIGTEITITPGTWTGTPTLTYQWQRNTGSWADIGSATNDTYTPVDADFGYALRVVETANGATSANSAATASLTAEAVTQAWSGELLTNGNLSTWTGGTPDGWTKQNDNGTTAQIYETAPDGSAGTGAATTANDTSPVFVTIRQTVYTTGDWYETVVSMTAYTGGRADISYSGSGAPVPSLSSVRSARSVERAQNTDLMIQPGGALPRLFTTDDWGVKKLTPNTELVAPSADMDIKAYYTVPASPLAGDRVYLFGRKAAAGDYYLVMLDFGGSQWNAYLYSVASHARTLRKTAANVGATNGLRFYANGTTIRMYTTANSGGLWTQRDTDLTLSTYQTSTGVNVQMGSQFTLGNLTYEAAV